MYTLNAMNHQTSAVSEEDCDHNSSDVSLLFLGRYVYTQHDEPSA
jgi:hypothetical protein